MIGKTADKIREALERSKAFFNRCSHRERTMILVLTACAFLALDYFLLVAPALGVFNRVRPQVLSLEGDQMLLLDDVRNRVLIEKKLENAQKRLSEQERQFIAPNEIPALLENLSQLAGESEVKIISLRPLEETAPEKWGPYRKIPIKLSAVAGTHELGKFLARLEGGATFFRINQLQIQPNPMEIRRHLVEMDMEAVRKP